MKGWNSPSAFPIQSLGQHLREELETEVGEMQAGFLLDYFLKEEFGYWFLQMKRL